MDNKKRKLKQATHFGTVDIGGKELSCAVLEDGTRILTQTALFQAFGRARRGRTGADEKGSNLPDFILTNNLKPFIYRAFRGRTDFEVKYIGQNKKETVGYNAEILPFICDAYLLARDEGALNEGQQSLAIASDILMRSLAKVGIVALIDEATGYETFRGRDALQKLLRLYVSEELLPWQKTFPDIYYQELFRLNGWDFSVQGIKKRPSCIGTWTNKLIYEQMPPGVLEELKSKTPKTSRGIRSHRYFQLLTTDIGSPQLREQINQIITLFQLSDNMKHMWDQFQKLKARQVASLPAPYAFDEKGHSITPADKEEKLSDFNKNLEKAIEYSESDED